MAQQRYMRQLRLRLSPRHDSPIGKGASRSGVTPARCGSGRQTPGRSELLSRRLADAADEYEAETDDHFRFLPISPERARALALMDKTGAADGFGQPALV
jgi:hypothetical protein